MASLSEGLATWYPGLRLAVDLDRVPALAEDRQALWAQVNAAGFLDDAEKRAMLGIAGGVVERIGRKPSPLRISPRGA